MSDRGYFHLVMGDWSDDGHGRTERFTVSANGGVERARAAYFAATAQTPSHPAPDSFAADYEDCTVADSVAQTIRAASGIDFSDDLADKVRLHAEYTVWFLNQGDPGLDARLEDDEKIPMLHFYGDDKRGRHIPFFGYGWFS